MRITFEVEGTRYSADLDGSQYTLIKHGINNDPKSNNFGNPTEIALGYFSKLHSAVNKALQDTMGSKEEICTLGEFTSRVEAAKSRIEELIGEV